MAILATGTLHNVYHSLDAYVTAAVVTAMGLALRLHGTRRFVPPATDPWVEVDYSFLTLTRVFQRQVGGGYLGTEVIGPLSVGLYRQARVYTTDYTRDLAATRDTLLSHFPESGLIPLYDYSQVSGTPPSEAPQVAALYIDTITEQLLDNGAVSGVVTWEIRPTLRYLEEYTR